MRLVTSLQHVYAVIGIAISLVAAGCSKHQPRSFDEYMEDQALMEGMLARCNADREGTRADLDCANARRAAVTIALRIEQAKREELELESERKLAELRDELARRERAESEALAAAEAAKQAAYEAIWQGDKPPAEGGAELFDDRSASEGTAQDQSVSPPPGTQP